MKTKFLGKHNERGVSAVLVALLLVVLFAGAAVAYDLSNLVSHRQDLQNRLDTAAHAGAAILPDRPAEAVKTAESMMKAFNPQINPKVELFCIVASTGATRKILDGQIPQVCNPGPANVALAKCTEKTCVMPCPADNSFRCNTARVGAAEVVPYAIAPVIGLTEGTTGGLLSTACNGSCGEVGPNAMDVVVVADRTLSMSEYDLSAMKGGINAMLKTMTPELQYVALATIHRSDPNDGCENSYSASSGPWLASKFSNNYLNPGATGARQLNSSSDLVQKVSCIKRPTSSGRNHGTHLAAAMKGAADALNSPSAVSNLPKRNSKVQKVILFETDGIPDETMPSAPATSSNPAGGPQHLAPWSWQSSWERATGGVAGCQRLTEVAKNAKDSGILIITIGYGDAARQKCNLVSREPLRTDGETKDMAKNYLAAAASPGLDGQPSKADTDCTTAAGVKRENTDGDYFYCAADASQLAPIFESAITQVRKGIRFIDLPA